MNTSQTLIRFSRGPFLAICIAVMAFAQVGYAEDGKKFQALIHDKNLYGVEDVENGRYEVGIARLAKRVESSRGPYSTRVPALIDLCVAYTMTEQFDKARESCDRAVDSGWYSGHAYNNRGTYNIAIGDYEAAIRDFQSAIEGRGADDVARGNLEYAQERLVVQRELRDNVKFVARTVDPDATAE